MISENYDSGALFADALYRQNLLHLRVRAPESFNSRPIPPTISLTLHCSPVVIAEDMIGVAMYELVRL